ncbi:ankyrin repeat-containing protein [Hibiscus syriacus]|uniref:Ankyrin repeat-containing protein n=1 Tax=Hibiscus syriacus TaxID=106335 RepID=A0A6A2WZ88_HIBSY|nr:probable membrane-associated kinase regulator 4 [Hibiscus syriacus]KAE8661070.1 ankyrin repeat-containing protein [Hibiscus syriacus]
MAISQASFNNDADEDYIDMELSSSSSSKFLCYSISSPPQSREFEFQMCAVDCNREITSTTSPADELFYKGKLLPLHLPPRLQMVQTLLQSSETHAIGSTNGSVTMESCTVSSELNPDDYFFEWSTEMNGFRANDSNNSWSKKLKQMKQSLMTQKLKASREYLKSLFTKSACSDESCAKAATENGSETNSKYMKMAKKKPFGNINRELAEDVADSHRRSFSGVIHRHSATKSSSGSSSSSTSFSFSSSGFCDLQLLKRSNSANSEIESSIEGAIAHCKQSQKLGVCSLSASKISVCGDQERSELCSI